MLITVLVAKQIQYLLHLRNILDPFSPRRAARKVERVEARGDEARELGCRPAAEIEELRVVGRGLKGRCAGRVVGEDGGSKDAKNGGQAGRDQ